MVHCLPLSIRLDFEGVVSIGAFALEPLVDGASQISRDKEDPPALILSNMDPFMGAGDVEPDRRLRQHDMPQRDCENVRPHRQQMADKPFCATAIKLNDTLAKLAFASKEQSRPPYEQPPECVGKGPNNFQKLPSQLNGPGECQLRICHPFHVFQMGKRFSLAVCLGDIINPCERVDALSSRIEEVNAPPPLPTQVGSSIGL